MCGACSEFPAAAFGLRPVAELNIYLNNRDEHQILDT